MLGLTLLALLFAVSDGVHDERGFGNMLGDIDALVTGLGIDKAEKGKIKGMVKQAKDIFNSLGASPLTQEQLEAKYEEGKDDKKSKFGRFVKGRLDGTISVEAIDMDCDGAADEFEFAVFFVRALKKNMNEELPEDWPEVVPCEPKVQAHDGEDQSAGCGVTLDSNAETLPEMQAKCAAAGCEYISEVDEDTMAQNRFCAPGASAEVANDDDETEEVASDKGETGNVVTDDGECDGLDVNTASHTALKNVKGVGRVTMKAISENRPYNSVQDFQEKFSKATVGKKGTLGKDVWDKNVAALFRSKQLCVVPPF